MRPNRFLNNWKPLEHKHRRWNSIYHGTAYSDGKGWYIDKYQWKRQQSELMAIIEEGTSEKRLHNK